MKKSHKARRLLCRSGLTAYELDRLITQIGLRQVLAALDRVAGPANSLARRRSHRGRRLFFLRND